MAEDPLRLFDKIVEEKRKVIDGEIDKIIDNIMSKIKLEISSAKDKALKQITQLLKPGT